MLICCNCINVCINEREHLAFVQTALWRALDVGELFLHTNHGRPTDLEDDKALAVTLKLYSKQNNICTSKQTHQIHWQIFCFLFTRRALVADIVVFTFFERV